jgi:hypothetical protein
VPSHFFGVWCMLGFLGLNKLELRLRKVEQKNEALEQHLERLQNEWRATKEKLEIMVREVHKTSSI